MDVERATLADIDALVQARIDFLTEDFGGLDASDEALLRERLPEYFRARLNREIFCYGIREGDVMAACAFLLVVEKPMSPAFRNGKTGIVLNVYTRREFRRRGYGRAVMEALLADAERMRLSGIELKATEDGARLYQSLGFADDVSKYRRMKIDLAG